MISHKYYIKCKRCGGDMIPQKIDGIIMGLECNHCEKREITSDMTREEYEVVLSDFVKAGEVNKK